MKTRKKARYITSAAIIAATYVILTYITNLFGLASSAVQCRLSEALCVLPAFTPAAVPGLFIGCVLSNILTGGIIFDVIFGSLATLIGACFTRLLALGKASEYLYPVPAIISNTVIVPLVLKYAYALNGSVWYFVLTVGLGEIISCGVLGMMLYGALKNKSRILFN